MPLHPRLVHFPIALLLIGTLAALWYAWREPLWLKNWGRLSLTAGWLLTIPALITGLIDKSRLATGSPPAQLADQHTTGIFAMWILYGLALYWRIRWRSHMDTQRRWLWTGMLILASGVLLLASHWGGKLVYELGVGVR